ncbi:hypothetical protein, partial [Vibrio vulnificus]|uniref:hypothetical protein n=1 Tax=Vibrio vulnificus TaxID=672 RepID=UPI0039B440A6
AIQSLDNILGPSTTSGSGTGMPDTQAQTSFDQMLHQLQANPTASQNKLLAHASPLLRLICTIGALSDIPSHKALSATLSKGL